IAFRKIELTTDDVIARLGVATDLDPLNVGARAFVNHERDVDDVRLIVAVTTRTNLREDVSLTSQLDRKVLDRLLNVSCVKSLAAADLENTRKRLCIDPHDRRVDINRTELVLRALINRV